MRDLQNVVGFSRHGSVSVISIQNTPSVPPETLRGKLATWTCIDALLEEDPPPFPYYEPPLSSKWWQNHLGHPSDHLWTPFKHEALRRHIAQSNVNLAIIEDVGLWRYVAAIRDHCEVILDCHNAQNSLDRECAAALSGRSYRSAHRMLKAADNMERIHRNLTVSAFIACSEIDRQRLTKIGLGDRPVYLVHNALDVHEQVGKVERPPVSAVLAQLTGPIVLFAGVLNYPPNQNAAMALVNQIFPLVQKQLPGSALVLVGRSPTNPLIAAVRNSPNVFLTGEVMDTRPYFEMAHVLCVPLQEGGGTRFKILEAFRHSVPVVSSRKGAEGLIIKHRQDLLIAETAEEYASAIVEVLTEKNLGGSLSRAGYSKLLKYYSYGIAQGQIDRMLTQYFGIKRP